MKRCLVCGRGDDDRPMIYRGALLCSGRCRKIAAQRARVILSGAWDVA